MTAVPTEIRKLTPIAAPAEEQAQFAALSRALADMERTGKHATPDCKLVGPTGTPIAIPESVFYLLERIVQVMSMGDSITVVPVGKEVTTQQAAALLNVSRQYLVRLLDEGRMPFRRTGKHRRVRVEDVLAFKQARDSERRKGLRELSELTQELGGYDDELK